MKRVIMLTLILAIVLPLGLVAADDGLTWHTWLNEAEKVAQKENKPMLLFFTGSDWCGWCIKLVNQVLSKPAFIKYAKEELVLVKLDFPRKKALDADQKEQNNQLAKKYQVPGFPTIILLNAKGETLGQTSYQDLSPEDYVEHLKGFIK